MYLNCFVGMDGDERARGHRRASPSPALVSLSLAIHGAAVTDSSACSFASVQGLARWRHDRSFRVLCCLTKDLQNRLLHDLRKLSPTFHSERQVLHLVSTALKKAQQCSRRNRRNSMMHAKGFSAKRQRVGCGKNGFVLSNDVDVDATIEKTEDCSVHCSVDDCSSNQNNEKWFRCACADSRRSFGSESEAKHGSRRTKRGLWVLEGKLRKARRVAARVAARAKANLLHSRAMSEAARTPPPVRIDREISHLIPPESHLQTHTERRDDASLSAVDDCTQVRSATVAFIGDAAGEVHVALANGIIILEGVGFSCDDTVAELQCRILDALCGSYSLVLPNGLKLDGFNRALTVEQVGIAEGDVITAVVSGMTIAMRNTCSMEERIESDIMLLEDLLADAEHFRRMASSQFRLLYKMRAFRKTVSPCTDLIKKLCDRLSLPHVDQERLLNLMDADSVGKYTFTERQLARILRIFITSARERLKKDLAFVQNQGGHRIPRLLYEEGLRRRLASSDQEHLVLETYGRLFMFGSRISSAVVRLSRDGTLCQLLTKPNASYSGSEPPSGATYRSMSLAVGTYRIQGDSIMLNWTKTARCTAVLTSCTSEMRGERRVLISHWRRSTPWQQPHTLLPEHHLQDSFHARELTPKEKDYFGNSQESIEIDSGLRFF